ncbi:MAG: hypothetical protein GY800_03320 [Planctomycetes bacterium]|nr:hypothetical protein [Planctomycetota bacterium]
MQYMKQKWSILAIASLAMGALSLIVFFLVVNIAIMVVQILLSIGAIVTGIYAMRVTRTFGLRGHYLAYAGTVCGANGLFWVIINTVFSLFR